MPKNFHGDLGTKDDPLTAEKLKDDKISDIILNFFARYQVYVNFTGHGSKNQFTEESLQEANEKIDELVKDMNKKHGAGNWAVVYGGDPSNPAKPDIGMVLNRLHKSRVAVIAIQCDKYAAYMFKDGDANTLAEGPSYEVLEHGGAAVVYETEEDDKGVIKFGGHDDDYNPVGTTRYIAALCGDKLRYHFALGGGAIAAQEYEFFARESVVRKETGRPELEVTYMKLEARNPTPIAEFLKLGFTEEEAKASAKYGIVDAFYEKENTLVI